MDAFDLEGAESGSVCRTHALHRAQAAEAHEAKIAMIERQRRTHIAALVKLDAELAELRGGASSPFTRVETADVFEGADGESDGDLGVGD
jgi:hypothetical protein